MMKMKLTLAILVLLHGARIAADDATVVPEPQRFFAETQRLLTPASCSSPPAASGCCICFSDDRKSEDRKGFQKTCEEWFRQQESFCTKNAQTRLPYRGQMDLASAEARKLPLSCSAVRIYGAFHGLPEDVAVPFNLSRLIAGRTGAKDVCYDGLSCFVFKDVAKVKSCAADLLNDSCRYDISGNQNVGVGEVRKKSTDAHREMDSAKSRLRALITPQNGVEIIPAGCSPAGSECGWILSVEARSSRRDLNEKLCRHQGRTLRQICCAPDRYQDRDFAYWSDPGEDCQ